MQTVNTQEIYYGSFVIPTGEEGSGIRYDAFTQQQTHNREIVVPIR